MWFPSIIDDELGLGYIGRISYFNHFRKIEDCISRIKYHPELSNDNPSTASLPIFLAHELNMSLKQFIKRHSILPITRTVKNRQECHSHVTEIERNGNSSLSFLGNSTKLNFCEYCMNDDWENYGCCLWHRSHQFHGIITCHIHRTGLRRANSLKISPPTKQLFSKSDPFPVKLVCEFNDNLITRNYEQIYRYLAERDRPFDQIIIRRIVSREILSKDDFSHIDELKITKHILSKISKDWTKEFFKSIQIIANSQRRHLMTSNGFEGLNSLLKTSELSILLLAATFENSSEAIKKLDEAEGLNIRF